MPVRDGAHTQNHCFFLRNAAIRIAVMPITAAYSDGSGIEARFHAMPYVSPAEFP